MFQITLESWIIFEPGSVIPIIKIHDSLRYLNKKEYKNVKRDNIFAIQTPQGFNYKKIFNAYKNLDKIYTDDSMIAFENNIKITKKVKKLKIF